LLRAENDPDEDFISLYEKEMAVAGEFVYERRKAFLEEFIPIFQRIYGLLAGESEEVNLEYRSVCQNGPLEEQIRASRSKDHIMGFSLCGVHRDDLEMSLHGFPIKREGSQGQNKSFVISLKLSQFDFLKNKGDKCVPILLLDDIFDKLDTRRVEQIVKMVSEDDFGQIFITDTSRNFLNSVLQQTGKDFRFFTVDGGRFK
jgi:DNA replication and repair protein RecF